MPPRRKQVSVHERRELEGVLRRAYALSSADQLALYETLAEYLGRGVGTESQRDAELKNRAEALRALEQASKHADLGAGRRLTVARFDRVARELGLDWNGARVIRAWGSWGQAKTALAGGRISESPGQRGVRRKSSGRKRSHEEYLAGVRAWLGTDPPSTSMRDYDRFAQESQGRPGLPLVRYTSLHNALGLAWPEILAVARGEAEHIEMRRQSVEAIKPTAGPLELVGNREIALLLGVNMTCVHIRLRRGDLPSPVARLDGHPTYFLGDILAYCDHEPWPKRPPCAWQGQLIDSAQLAERLGIAELSVKASLWRRSWHLVPEPAGRAARSPYWMPDELERWFIDHPKRAAASE